ncbi:hypothetical protein D3C86_1547340 [compost metagenome]
MPLTWGRTSATRNGDVRPGNSVVRETGCVVRVTTVTCGLPAWGASCFLPQAAKVRADAVSATTAAPRHIALFLFISCIPDFQKIKPPRCTRFACLLPPEGAVFALGRPGGKQNPCQTVIIRSVRIDWGGFALNTQAGLCRIAALQNSHSELSRPRNKGAH